MLKAPNFAFRFCTRSKDNREVIYFAGMTRFCSRAGAGHQRKLYKARQDEPLSVLYVH